MTYTTDPMGAALDRHITGDWGEDSVDELDPRCLECEEGDACAFNHDARACETADQADILYDTERDGGRQ